MASSQPSETISNFYETTCMDSELFLAAANGQLDVFTALDLVYILTPEKNTVLHVNIITSESTDISFAVGIVEMCPPLLQQTNARGETPLLLAARYGRHCIVEFLINRAKTLFEQDDLEKANAAVNNEVFKQIMRIPNQNKDTALHEAVRFNHLKVVRILTKEDPHFSYSTNEDGETPLYLAVEGGYLKLVDEILQNCPSPATSGPKGRTVLHVAVWHENIVSDHRCPIIPRRGSSYILKHLSRCVVTLSVKQMQRMAETSNDTGGGSKRGRGAYYGANIEKELAIKKVTHLKVEFDKETGKAIQKYGKWFNNSMARYLRSTVPPTTLAWEQVKPADIEVIRKRLSEKFIYPEDNPVINDAMVRQMQKHLTDWRHTMKKHWVDVGGEVDNERAKSKPFVSITSSDWAVLCDFWVSDSHQRISKKNKEARAKMTIPGGHGSKSIVAHVYDHMDPSTGQLPSMIDTFEHLHKKKDKWISDAAATKHNEMTERRASQSTAPASSAASCVGDNVDGHFPPDMDIVTDVLGPRSRYKKGFGGLPRLKAIGAKRAASSSTSQMSGQLPPEVDTILQQNQDIMLENQNLKKHTTKLESRQRRQDLLLSALLKQVGQLAPGFTVDLPDQDSDEDDDADGGGNDEAASTHL